MNRKYAIAFVVAGLMVLSLGSYAYDFTNTPVSRAVTGGSTDAALTFIISGLLAAITGVFGLDASNSES